jgi:hypothetical protein
MPHQRPRMRRCNGPRRCVSKYSQEQPTTTARSASQLRSRMVSLRTHFLDQPKRCWERLATRGKRRASFQGAHPVRQLGSYQSGSADNSLCRCFCTVLCVGASTQALDRTIDHTGISTNLKSLGLAVHGTGAAPDRGVGRTDNEGRNRLYTRANTAFDPLEENPRRIDTVGLQTAQWARVSAQLGSLQGSALWPPAHNPHE